LTHSGSQHRHAYPWLSDEKQLQTVAKCVQQQASGAENIDILPLLLQRGTSERGIFVEIGANDGIDGSNTLVLERCFNWTGLLIEASPDTFTKLLQSQRSATMVNAPSCPNGQVVQMSRAGGGVAAVVDFASHSYMAKWGHHMGSPQERVNVTCREMRDIMRDAGHAHAHFLSLDVQGAEEVVLRTADIRSFSTVLVEAEGTAKEKNRRVHDLLLSHGFRQLPNPTASRAHKGTGYNEIYAQSSVHDIRPFQTLRRKPAGSLAEIIANLQSLKNASKSHWGRTLI
jgi:FkbM family methyltransferase